MSDRIHSLTVILTADKRDDDCEAIIQAIQMIKGVGSVRKHVSDPVSTMAEWRAKRELSDKIWAILGESVS